VAKVNVYIDGFNLYYGALKGTPYKWLDLARLCQALLPSDTIQEIKYFTARVSARPSKPTSAHDQGLYIRALRTLPNLTIKYGHFLTHTVPMYLATVTPPQRVWVGVRSLRFKSAVGPNSRPVAVVIPIEVAIRSVP
jgi:hypothetical protein